MAGAVRVLASYPAWLVENIVDPLNGLPSRHEFFPSLKVLIEECEILWQRFERDRERDLRIERQLGQRLLAAPQEERPTYAELKEKYGDGNGGWGIGPRRERPGFKPIPIEQLHAMAGDEWDKIPDAKDYDFTKLDSVAQKIIGDIK